MRVAIIGAGPGGIVAARYLLRCGLQPVLFEQSDQAGGQWHVGNSLSGIWPGMPTNTSRIMTQFSDLEHSPELAAFPSAEQIHDYLQRYMDAFGIRNYLRLNTKVVHIECCENNRWQVTYQAEAGSPQVEVFDFVLIASGRFNHPYVPAIPGLENVSGNESGNGLNGQTRLQICHSHDYMGVEAFHGKRVLVAGGAISALEIASDLAINSDAQVSCAYRNQRYVLGKVAQGIPTDHINFSLYEALAAERLDSNVLAAQFKKFILREFGSPEDYGAPRPNADVRKAGTTKCGNFLRLLAQNDIRVRPWIDRVEGQTVIFSDSSEDEYDCILFATGYRLELAFLGQKATQLLNLTDEHIGLYQHTLHPDLPGLAVLGFYNQVGPYFPVLEQQARWISYLWSQRLPMPSASVMRAQLLESRDSWMHPEKMPMHKLAMLFARSFAAEPDPDDWPEIQRALWFGPLCAAVFRLSGPDALSDAPQRVLAAGEAFDMIKDPEFTAEERRRLEAIGE